MEIIYPMVVDLARPNKYNTLLVMKNDFNSRKCRFILMDNGKAFDTADVLNVVVKAVKPDGTVVFEDAEISTDDDGNRINEIMYPLPAAITDTSGKTTMTITMTGENSQLTSFEFYVNTRNELYSEDDYASEDDLSGFRDLLNRALETVAQVEQMAQRSTLPNPQPLVITDKNGSTTYSGSERIEYSMIPIQDSIAQIRQSFADGCSRIAQAVTNNGVTTSSTAGVSDIVTNIGKIRTGGTATKAQILTGFNAYAKGALVAGEMPNRGNLTRTLQPGESQAINLGYYTGGKLTVPTLETLTSFTSTESAADTSHVLNGYYYWSKGKKYRGGMPNHGAWKSEGLLCGNSVPVPRGYHDGNGYVKAADLRSQTPPFENLTAVTAQTMRRGYCAYINGDKVRGGMTEYTGSVERASLLATTDTQNPTKYTIPAGWHDGNGYVTGRTLASQTSGNATKSTILNGYTAWVNGKQVTGEYTPSTVITPTTKNLQMAGHTGNYGTGTASTIEGYDNTHASGHLLHLTVTQSESLRVSGNIAAPTVERSNNGYFDVMLTADGVEAIHMTFYLNFA